MEDHPVKNSPSEDPVEAWLRSRVRTPEIPDQGFSAGVLARLQRARRPHRDWVRLGWALGLASATLSLAAAYAPAMSALAPAAEARHPLLLSGAGQFLLLGSAALLYSNWHYLAAPLGLAARSLASLRGRP